jgi:hypothetical protein
MTHLRLIMPCVSLAPSLQQCVVDVAHNVLSQRIKAVEIVRVRPVSGFVALEGGVVLAQVYLYFISYV